jgi:hypothetical protein
MMGSLVEVIIVVLLFDTVQPNNNNVFSISVKSEKINRPFRIMMFIPFGFAGNSSFNSSASSPRISIGSR